MLKVGVVGAGIRGKLFAEAAKINMHTEFQAFCDLNKQVVEDYSKEHGVKGYVDYQEMLDKEKLDIICITTPDFAHKDIVISSARKKVNVFVEKPLALSSTDCEEIETVVNENGIKLTVAYTNRWNPPYRRAKEIIDRGEVGDILSINARLNNTIMIPTKMLSWAAKTSPAWFLTSHPLDLALWYTKKKVVKVYATGFKKVLVKKGIDTWDCIHSTVIFEDGTDAVFESCWVLPEGLPKIVDYKYQIIGTEGVLNLDMQDQMIHFSDQKRTLYPDTFMIDLYGHKFGHNLICFDSFVDSILNDTEPIVQLKEAKENVIIIEGIHKSLETGEPVNIRY